MPVMIGWHFEISLNFETLLMLVATGHRRTTPDHLRGLGEGSALIVKRISAWCQAKAASSCGISSCSTTSNPSGTIRLAWFPFGPSWTSKLTV